MANAPEQRAECETRYRELRALWARALKRAERTLAKQKEELAQAQRHAWLQQVGDTLLASLPHLHTGLTATTLANVHTGTQEQIALNPRLDGRGNAQLYYRKARRARRGLPRIEQNVAATTGEIARLQALTPLFQPGRTDVQPDEIPALQEQLRAAGLVLPGTRPPRPPGDTPRVPVRTLHVDGYDILVGKNDEQNDELTVHTAKPWDIWLHVAAHAGSHVVVRRQRGAPWPPQRVMTAAATLAAWFSKTRHAGSAVEVHVAERRHVEKRRRMPAGQVVLRQYQTLRVAPLSPQELFRKLGLEGGQSDE